MSSLLQTISILLVLVVLAPAKRCISAEDDLALDETLADMNQRIMNLEWENSQPRRLPIVENSKRHSHGTSIEFSGRIHIDHWAFPGDSPGVNAFDSGDSTITS